jgi:UDP-N-acetylglucosamine transferase subunit ALG13
MIFVTVGTERFPFDRLLRAVDKLARQGLLKDVYCQIGASGYKPAYCSYKVFLPFEEVVYCIQESELVIAHGGAGIVALCLKFGKIPILAPRQKRFGEHVDDHQVEFARHMERLQRAVAILDLERFDEALAKQHQLQMSWESGQLSLPQQNSLLGTHLRELLARWEQTLYPSTSK